MEDVEEHEEEQQESPAGVHDDEDPVKDEYEPPQEGDSIDEGDNDCDPISLEPLSTLSYPPFRLWAGADVWYGFDGRVLANYLVSTGVFLHPISRRPLRLADCVALDGYTRAHGLGDAHMERAFRHKEAYASENATDGAVVADLQAEASTVLSSLFAVPQRPVRQARAGFRMVDDDRGLAAERAWNAAPPSASVAHGSVDVTSDAEFPSLAFVTGRDGDAVGTREAVWPRVTAALGAESSAARASTSRATPAQRKRVVMERTLERVAGALAVPRRASNGRRRAHDGPLSDSTIRMACERPDLVEPIEAALEQFVESGALRGEMPGQRTAGAEREVLRECAHEMARLYNVASVDVSGGKVALYRSPLTAAPSTSLTAAAEDAVGRGEEPLELSDAIDALARARAAAARRAEAARKDAEAWASLDGAPSLRLEADRGVDLHQRILGPWRGRYEWREVADAAGSRVVTFVRFENQAACRDASRRLGSGVRGLFTVGSIEPAS